MTTIEQGTTQGTTRYTLPLAALLALLGTATAANAGQILLVNAIDNGMVASPLIHMHPTAMATSSPPAGRS